MARSRSAASQTTTAESEYREIIGWYERELEAAAPPTDLRYEPVKIGPTWQYENGWVLPAVTLGWRNLAWAGMHLKDSKGQPWTYTLEQARFILWMDALDPETGEFAYSSAVLQRLKGWGKDPLAASVSMSDICSEDAAFDHWRGDVPVGKQQPNAFVQIIGVSQDQIKRNTFKLFPSLVPVSTRRKYGVQIGKLSVWARGDEAQIEASTTSVGAIEGPRPTRVIRNETQNWNESNGGHDMAGAVEGNAAKAEAGASRILDICNAYRDGEDSVGERRRKSYNKTVGVRCKLHAALEGWPKGCLDCQPPSTADFGLLYDSLEAPPEAPLTAEAAPAVVEAIRGDSIWLNTKRILRSILDTNNSASESRRKWYNQINAAEDAWLDPKDIKAGERDEGLEPGDVIVLFGDGSKSDDATGLIGVRISDGHAQVLHVQQPKKGQIVNRHAVDLAVIKAFETYKVKAFWFDPSHARDDDAEGDNRFWWPMVDDWSKRYGRRLKCWPVKSGVKTHAVAFDMALEINQKTFVEGCDQVAGEVEGQAAEGAPKIVTFKKSQWLTDHLTNAKQAPGKYGVSIRKDNRESRHKIDLAVCLAGARTLRRIYLLSIKKGTPGKGRVIVMDD